MPCSSTTHIGATWTLQSPLFPLDIKDSCFSLPPPQAQQLRQAAKEEERTVSELLREAIRLHMEEREWRVEERMQRRSRQTNTDESEAR